VEVIYLSKHGSIEQKVGSYLWDAAHNKVASGGSECSDVLVLVGAGFNASRINMWRTKAASIMSVHGLTGFRALCNDVSEKPADVPVSAHIAPVVPFPASVPESM
jgi:hypothetical protein